MRITLKSCLLTALVSAMFCSANISVAQQAKKKKKKRRPNSVFAKIKDVPNLPRVLLIGDSISIGYTQATRIALQGKANVHRIPTNGGPTSRGLQQIDKWLGTEKWDVIHFNWGLHDLKYIGEKRQVPIDAYEINLRKLVAKLKATKATLIWCQTTPVPAGVKPRRSNDDVITYNTVATKIMKENGITIDDLYTFANDKLSKIQRPKNVHFSPAGSKILASQVAKSIQQVLKK